MNCPACLSLMSNKDEIHKISPTKNRMNLHCNNYKNCPARKMKLCYGPYMQVITNDPNPWECINYGLIMKNNKPILLQGDFVYDFTVAKVIDTIDVTSPGIANLLPSVTSPKIIWKDIRKVKFVQLSTNNDMHIQAIQLTDKLTKLIPFL